jgi:hypothetical protein
MSCRSILVSLLAVVLFGGPLLACTVPGTQLSADEKECCKQMGGACHQNGSGMPRSHSCCESVVQPQRNLLPSSTFSFSGPTLVVSAVDLPAEFPLAEQSGPFVGSFSHAYSPPGEAVGASAPLRI